MLKVFEGEIKMTEKIYPCQIACIFVNGVYHDRIALTRPGNTIGKPSFKFYHVLDVNRGDVVRMYLSGQRVDMTETNHDIQGFNWVTTTILELKQDLQCSGFTTEEFPELAYYLDFEPPPANSTKVDIYGHLRQERGE